MKVWAIITELKNGDIDVLQVHTDLGLAMQRSHEIKKDGANVIKEVYLSETVLIVHEEEEE